MNKKINLSKTLAIIGTALVWPPVLMPLLFGLFSLFRSGVYRFDYLMPAEFFLVFAVGAALLVASSLLGRLLRRLICWSAGISVLAFIGINVSAEVTGLASGETAAAGWPMALVIACLVVYTAGIIAIGIGGILLLRDLYRSRKQKTRRSNATAVEN